jgi:Bacterial regulatory proteins, lacI family
LGKQTAPRRSGHRAVAFFDCGPRQEAEFLLQFTEARGFPAPDPFTVSLSLQDGECRLERSNANLAVEIDALMQKATLRKDIAKLLGVSPSTVSRQKRKVSERGKRIMDRAQEFDK